MRLKENTACLSAGNIKHRLPTNTLSKSKRLHRWGNFIAGYSIEFVEKCLEDEWLERSEKIVLDPFSGCGTTLLSARNLGFQTVGYELHPVFHTISTGKLQTYRSSDIDSITQTLQSECVPIGWSEDARRFLSKLFNPANLRSIETAAANIKNSNQLMRSASTTLFLKACEYSCGSQTDGVYKAPTTKKRHIPFAQAIEKVADEFREDISSDWYQNHWAETIPSVIYNKSATEINELEASSISYCITSPPYLNNFDYAEMTRMHLYLLGWCDSWGDISSKIRNHLITNTTTALKGKKKPDFQTRAKEALPKNLAHLLEPIVAELSIQRKERAGKKAYDYLIYPYYAEIGQVLKNVYQALEPNGKIHWVVADAALYGVHIETQEHTAMMMKELGYKDINIRYMRRRGHRWILSKRDGAKKGLGEYHIEAVK